MKIALIACTKKKCNCACSAKELYAPSTLFAASYQYAKALQVDKIYILSTKYGLVHEDEIIAPYEVAIKDLKKDARKDWVNKVKQQLETELDPLHDEFIALVGKQYLNPLIKANAFAHYSEPLEGMTQGNRVSFMQREVIRLAK